MDYQNAVITVLILWNSVPTAAARGAIIDFQGNECGVGPDGRDRCTKCALRVGLAFPEQHP
jgi:hypothetical protein